ncbi:hypothetical protein [Rhodoblastus sp.]
MAWPALFLGAIGEAPGGLDAEQVAHLAVEVGEIGLEPAATSLS